jgi:hypothetical protein
MKAAVGEDALREVVEFQSTCFNRGIVGEEIKPDDGT